MTPPDADTEGLANAFFLFLTTQSPVGAQEEGDFAVAAQDITGVCMTLFSDSELAALAERLEDPSLSFASKAGAEAAAAVVVTIRT